MAANEPRFSAIPLRALVDPELRPAHIKALAIVAAFDRMSLSKGEGRGAFVRQGRMAEIMGVDKSRFSKLLAHLLDRGYLTRQRREDRRTQYILRVRYLAADAAFYPKSEVESVVPEDNYPPAPIAPTVDPEDNLVPETVVQNEEIVGTYGPVSRSGNAENPRPRDLLERLEGDRFENQSNRSSKGVRLPPLNQVECEGLVWASEKESRSAHTALIDWLAADPTRTSSKLSALSQVREDRIEMLRWHSNLCLTARELGSLTRAFETTADEPDEVPF